MTETDLVLGIAAALDFVREEPRNSNKGQAVERFLLTTGFKTPQPWCAAYVAYVGESALGKRWPLPLTAGCATLHDAATRRGILREKPAYGDVFLIYYPSKNRMAHTGFVTEVLADGRCRTLEGNTNGGGSRDGWGVFPRIRTFGPNDRFIRWTDAT